MQELMAFSCRRPLATSPMATEQAPQSPSAAAFFRAGETALVAQPFQNGEVWRRRDGHLIKAIEKKADRS